MARALRFQASVPLKFWGECVTTAVYILNRLPSKVIDYKYPFEMLYLHSPSLYHLRIFGCLCYAATPRITDKFSPKAVPAVLMEYFSTQKGYLLYELHSKTFLVSRNVIFKEDVFPFKHVKSYGNPVFPMLDLLSPIVHENSTADTAAPASCSSPSLLSEVNHLSDVDLPQNSDLEENIHVFEQNVALEQTAGLDAPSSPPAIIAPDDVSAEPFQGCRRSSRPSKPPIWLQDFVTQAKGSKCTFPISAHVDYNNLSLSYKQAVSAYSAVTEPSNFKEAASDPKWIEAMKLELQALEANNT
ncbi:PREDICTED: uncharacterized protein LOC109207913 [Nicotiana attenuata]|uniref:uncharacterized protein LOC109207913 n=1 Tax=Nicotiana attenuata TaxID=49451 RepID=UPI0009053FBF|nr:PREDICTED: uncharacterized protein LOC109207913 [Nicotiana attenuata]